LLKDIIEEISEGNDWLHEVEPGLSSMGLINPITEEPSFIIEFRSLVSSCCYNKRGAQVDTTMAILSESIERYYDAFSALIKGKDYDVSNWYLDSKGKNRCEAQAVSHFVDDKLVLPPDTKQNKK